MISIKTQDELKKMKQASHIVSTILEHLSEEVRPGVSLIELDALAEKLTLENGAKPAFKGYHGYRHTLCTSVNEQVVHGVPSKRKLKEGDIVGLDFGVIYEGFYGDSAVTLPVGAISSEDKALLSATKEALYAAIKKCYDGTSLKEIARSIEEAIQPNKFGIVREFVGHGIGRNLHEDPQISNCSQDALDVKLKNGMTICIEPMITTGLPKVMVLDDGWTAVTVDSSRSAHFEHTIAITEEGPIVLTEWSKPYFGTNTQL